MDDPRDFLDALSGVSPHTRDAYRYALNLFSEFKLNLDNDCQREFSTRMSKRGLAKATQQLYLSALRRYIDWLDAEDRLPETFNRAKSDARLRASRSRRSRDPYRPKEIDPRLPEIIHYYDGLPIPKTERRTLELLRNRAIMHTLYSSAGRVSEIASLARTQVADGQATQATTIGKGGKSRMIYLTPEAQAAIRAYCSARKDTYPALFISHGRNKGEALTRSRVWQIVKAAAKVLGLSSITSPHSFRHYRATQLLNEGMSLEFVQEYLGHSSPATTSIVYAHASRGRLIEQLREYGLPPRAVVLGAENADKPY